MQYPPLNASFSYPLLLELSLQHTHKAEGEPKPQKLKIDQAVWEGAVTGGSTYRPLALFMCEDWSPATENKENEF